MQIDLEKMQEHLRGALSDYRKHGLRYGSATFTVPEGLDETSIQMGLAAFLTVLESLGCVPFHMETKGGSIERALVTVGNQRMNEGSIRRVVYFRFMDEEPSAEPALQ